MTASQIAKMTRTELIATQDVLNAEWDYFESDDCTLTAAEMAEAVKVNGERTRLVQAALAG